MFQFVENLIKKTDLEKCLDEKPFCNLKYFRIKCFSFNAIAMAGLREFRFSKLCSRKSIALINKENQQQNSKTSINSNYRSSATTNKTTRSDFTFNESSRDYFGSFNQTKLINFLKVELLMNASEATHQIIKTFKEMKNIDFSILSDFKANNLDIYEKNELDFVLECYDKRIEYAKQAYLESKSLIDPNLRIQATFNLAISLYDNNLFQSAAYYFNECLSISTVLIKSPQEENNEFNYLTDIRPDYHLESAVYLAKCQLVLDYCQTESIVELNEDFQTPLNKEKDQPIDVIYNKLIRCNETICERITKWKLNETNRTSFNFNHPDISLIKTDKESERLNAILDIVTDCLVYISFRLNKFDECLFYSEHNKYLLNLDSNDLIERFIMKQNNSDLALISTVDSLKQTFKEMKSLYIFFKFIFNGRLLYIFYVDQNGEIKFKYEIKLSLLYNINELNVNLYNKKLNNSELDYLTRKFELIQNEWIKQNLNYYETRDLPSYIDMDLKKQRVLNRFKEKKFYTNLNRPKLDTDNLYQQLTENNREKLDDLAAKKTFVSPSLNFNENQLESEFELLSRNVLDPLFIYPIDEILQNIRTNETNDIFLNFSIDSAYSKLLVYIMNKKNQVNESKIFYNLILDSFLLPANSLIKSIEKEQQKIINLEIMRNKIIETPNRTKPITKINDTTNSIKVFKSSISPRNTSNPKLAHSMINQDPDKDYILIRNDHVQKAKNRLDSAVSTLISNTFSQADAKRSYLEIPEFKQVHKIEKLTVIGCPEVPKAYYVSLNKIEKFLLLGLEQLSQMGKLMHVNPIFSNKMTKQQVLNQLEMSTVLFMSTFSTNESDSALICSETPEYPNSIFEIDKYCKITSNDLNIIRMHQCSLLILNCYSVVHHRARIRLAKKFLSIGCQNVLLVFSPIPDHLMTKFYLLFIDNLKKDQLISVAYTEALSKMISILDSNILKQLINASFCLLSTKHVRISINEIAKSMVQSEIGDLIDDALINEESKTSILSQNFKSLFEKTLVDLQILFKLLLNQLITDSISYTTFKSNENLKNVFYYLHDLVSKAISYIKNGKIMPEKISKLIENNVNAKNILLCIGFNCAQSTSTRIRDQSDTYFISAPDKRYLDLNIRCVHILSALIEICFEKPIDTRSSISEKSENSINQDIYRLEASYMNQFYDKQKTSNNEEKIEIKIKTIIFNLQALMPINDRNLLTALIDILALTKFSSEIILSLNDQSVSFAMNYYENNSKFHKLNEYVDLMDKDIYSWSNRVKKSYNDETTQLNRLQLNYSMKFSINNKVANFLFSIGFEIVGQWLRFNDIGFNRRIIDLMLKLLTSFALDRDMTLYKDLNINVLGQRSAVNKSRFSAFFRPSPSSTNDSLIKNEDHFQLMIAKPWANCVETSKEMMIKLDYIEKFENLCDRLSIQRSEALKHYLDYTVKQYEMNEQMNIEEAENQENNNKVKFKAGGNPSKNRIIVNEKIQLNFEQVEVIRKYFHKFLKKNLQKISSEQKEKNQKLLLPLIKNKYNNVRYF